MTSAEEPLAALGRAVAKRRVELGHSAAEAARRAEVSRNTWHYVETGRRRAEDFIYGRMERLLEWAPGTMTSILEGTTATDSAAEPAEMVINDPDLIRYATILSDPDVPDWVRRAMWEQMRMWNQRAAEETESPVEAPPRRRSA